MYIYFLHSKLYSFQIIRRSKFLKYIDFAIHSDVLSGYIVKTIYPEKTKCIIV